MSSLQGKPSSSQGKVFLIGAGPGGPDLITLRGAALLGQADLVLYDYLVNPQILSHARDGAEKKCLGKHGQGRIAPQEEINRELVDAAQQGRVVARLKGGDPSVFGRGPEEIAALESAGISYEVVPGVTAAAAAASHAGVPLTHRDHASCVAFITGKQRGEPGDPLDIDGLAKFPGTLVFYMGVTTAPDWAPALIARGKSAATPVAIVRHCSLPQQQTLIVTLGELPAIVADGKLRPPAIIIVGEAVDARAKHNWFAARPLSGRTVLNARPAHQSEPLSSKLRELGARVIEQPAIRISPPTDWSPVDGAIARISDFDVIVFSSANGVRYFFDRIAHCGRDLRVLGQLKIAAIGPATAQELATRGLQADVQPTEFRAEALAAALAEGASGKRFLLIRASRGRDVLAPSLQAAGGVIEQVVAYASCDVTTPEPHVAKLLKQGGVDWVAVSSSAIARSLIHMFGNDLHAAKLAAISPLTEGVLSEAGHPASAVAETYTTDGLVTAILKAESAAR